MPRISALLARTSMLLLLLAGTAVAQYDIKQLADFEDGRLPANARLVGTDAEKGIAPVALDTVAGMPAGFRDAQTAKETQKNAVLIRVPKPPEGTSNVAGLVIGETLDRDSLGDKGRAIYQADFYVPAEDPPTIAVLAMEDAGVGSTGKAILKQYYRFGILKTGEAFFSLVVPNTTSARVLMTDKSIMDRMPRPGWHRFAVAFEGKDSIRCLIDGREPSFSPFKNSHLRKLSVGVLAAAKSTAVDAYVDNISIQFTSEAEVMPISPYKTAWKGDSATEQASGVAGLAPLPAMSELWMEPADAWKRAQQEKKPFLLYFWSPGAGATGQLETILSSDKTAQAFLKACACSRIDVNQLQGGMIASKYEVFRVPTFLLIAPDAQDNKRAVFRKGQTWEEFSSQLAGLKGVQ